MGLMDEVSGMKWLPAVRVNVNGVDVTNVITGSLISMAVTDTAGIQSDTLDIVIAGRVWMTPIAVPAVGAEIRVALGYGLAPREIGMFIVEETSIDGGSDGETITIRAYAAAYGDSAGGKRGINDEKNRSWAAKTKISEMVAKIAKESGFRAAVTKMAGAIELPHVDQISESDMSLLTRMARDNGLIFKPGGGALAMRSSGEPDTASGTPMPVVTLFAPEITSWSMAVRRPEAVKQVVTKYRNVKTARTVSVAQDARGGGREDEDGPKSVSDASATAKRLLTGVTRTASVVHTRATAAAAKAAAAARARMAYQKSQQLTVTLPGRADLTAEARVRLSGLRAEVDREWIVTAAVHQMDRSGWRTTIQAELPAAQTRQS